MKALRKLFARTSAPAELEAAYLRGRSESIDVLAAAKNEHIQDLRLLLDNSKMREDQLAGMVRMVMEERFFRPTITRDPSKPRQGQAIAPEAMQDVTQFDVEEDRKAMDQHAQRERDLQAEFTRILSEENEHRAGRGASPITA